MSEIHITENGVTYTRVKVAARKFSLAPDYISRMCRVGDVRAIRHAGMWYVDETALENFLKNQAAEYEQFKQRKSEEGKQVLRATEQAMHHRFTVRPHPHLRIHHAQQARKAQRIQTAIVATLAFLMLFSSTFAISRLPVAGVIAQNVAHVAAVSSGVPFLDSLADAIFRTFCPLFNTCPRGDEVLAQQPTAQPLSPTVVPPIAATPPPLQRAPAAPPVTQTVINQPVIERVIETVRTVVQSGTSALSDSQFAILSNRIDALSHRLNIQVDGIARSFVGTTGNSGGGGGSGSVTSINASGGTTGLSFSGGPIVSSGSFTLGGTLNTANGGTGTSTAPTQGQLLLGNASGGYDLVATSSLGISSGNSSNWDDAGTYLAPLTATDGILITASSTIGDGTATGGLTISGNATTTGDLNVVGSGIFTSSSAGPGFPGIVIVPSGTSFGNSYIGTSDGTTRLGFNTNCSGSGCGFGALNSFNLWRSSISTSGSDVTFGTPATNALAVSTGGTERMRIDSNGNVGIGTTSPLAKLSVHASAGQSDPAFLVASSSPTSEFFTITPSGNVGIGDDAGAADARLRITTPSSFSGNALVVRESSVGANGLIVGISGDLTIQGVSGYTSTDLLTLIGRSSMTADYINVTDASSNPIFLIDQNGFTGIGTSTPASKLDVWGDLRVGTSSAPTLFTQNSTGSVGIGTTNPLGLLDVNDGMFTITSGGQVVVNASSSFSGIGFSSGIVNNKLSGNTSQTNFSFLGGTAPDLLFSNSRGSSFGTWTVLQDGDSLGDIAFYGADGTNGAQGALIRASVDGTPGSNDMPGRLSFFTSADDTQTPLERLTINSTGNVGIGTSTPDDLVDIVGTSTQNLQLKTMTDTATPGLTFRNNVQGVNSTIWQDENLSLRLGTELGSEALTIDINGLVGIGTTTPTSILTVDGTVSFPSLSTGAGAGALCLSASGEVLYNAGAACFTSSQRFKHDITALTLGLDAVMAMRPVSYFYNDDVGIEGEQLGFIAEDILEIDERLVVLDASSTPLTVKYDQLGAVFARAIQEIVGVSGMFRENLAAWLADASNDIGEIFAKTLRAENVYADTMTTKELCVSDGLTQTCVTKAQLDSLLSNSGTPGVQSPVEQPAPEAEPEPTATTTLPVEDQPEGATSTPAAEELPEEPAEKDSAEEMLGAVPASESELEQEEVIE